MQYLNTTDKPIIFDFIREDGVAYIGGVINTIHETSQEADWFYLMPNHQVDKVGEFAGVNWEPIQTPIK